ncbi:hypothetical protein KAR91_02305 [Candidatus Pacearchaeota archaeon]|nr:hypothetical protein [Candidatus Pacearchaeota archaeon]
MDDGLIKAIVAKPYFVLYTRAEFINDGNIITAENESIYLSRQEAKEGMMKNVIKNYPYGRDFHFTA